MSKFRRRPKQIPLRVVSSLASIAALLVAFFALPKSVRSAPSGFPAAPAASSTPLNQPNFGSNVYVFTPDMPQSQIQATVDAVANQQISNQFGTQRYALLFEPGTYGSSTHPLNFQIGYYTAVAGLGLSPNDVVIHGSIHVYNQCFGAHNCTPLLNFWRSLSNRTLNRPTPNAGCNHGQFWAVSHTPPNRRSHHNR